jgi:alkanesulfonate monooxygenase SsuD/methylene tetrahydromethanopterin reductase-like flavin-dependent oxidoreductase (luciferase family)
MLSVAFRDTGLHLKDLVALARAADDGGYETIWSPEVGSRDAITLCALYGSVTHRANVGTGVVPIFARNIASLALSVATAAEASHGRFILGLGAGHRFTAEAWFEQTWTKPRTRMRETIDVLRRILAGERVTHQGTFSLTGYQLGSTSPEVPIYIAALTPPSLRMAGEIADGVILNWLPPEGVEKAVLLAREAAADAGRTIRIATYLRTAVVDDPAQEHTARQAVRDQTHAYLSLPTYANSVRQVGFSKELDDLAAGREHAIDVLADALCARGDAKTVQAKIKTFLEAGVDSVIVYPVPYGDDQAESVLHTIRNANAS